jgi:hypothetical protein
VSAWLMAAVAFVLVSFFLVGVLLTIVGAFA